MEVKGDRFWACFDRLMLRQAQHERDGMDSMYEAETVGMNGKEMES